MDLQKCYFSSCCFTLLMMTSVCLYAHTGADVQLGCGLDSPLHAAVRSGGANIVDLLLDFGADRWCRNTEAKTPLDLSSTNTAVRTALQQRGLIRHTAVFITIINNQHMLSNLLLLSPPQVPALCLSSVASVFAEVWEANVSTGYQNFSFLTQSKISSSTNDQFSQYTPVISHVSHTHTHSSLWLACGQEVCTAKI